MEMMYNLTKEQETQLASSLRDIYSSVVIEEVFGDESKFLEDILKIVEEDNKKTKEMIQNNPEMYYRIPSSNRLSTAFLMKYNNVMNKASEFAYSINEGYGYATNISTIIAPYILYQCGITNDNISFYLSLGLVLSNVVCAMMKKRQENIVKIIENDKLTLILETLEDLLENAQKENTTDENLEHSLQGVQELLKSIQGE